MDRDEVKKLIKENLKINIRIESNSSECSYNENTYVELVFMGEIISSSIIERLSVDH